MRRRCRPARLRRLRRSRLAARPHPAPQCPTLHPPRRPPPAAALQRATAEQLSAVGCSSSAGTASRRSAVSCEHRWGDPACRFVAWPAGDRRHAAVSARNPADLSRSPPAAPIEPLKPITTSPRKPIAQRHARPGFAPQRAGTSLARIRYQPLHGAGHVDQSSGAGHRGLDSAETGYEAWHSQPLGILSATNRSLIVYHTPEMHAVISEIVDRFVSSEAESQAFGLRVVTIGSPNWRAKAHSMLKPVPVQTQGIQAWLLAKEDAALMLSEMRKRMDFREHSSPHLVVNNGQSVVVPSMQPRW